MRLPVIRGLIRRRMLVNFRADPATVQRLLPAPFHPKLHAGQAIVGVCLIRLEQIRPAGLPPFLGIASENAAHRFAVTSRTSGTARPISAASSRRLELYSLSPAVSDRGSFGFAFFRGASSPSVSRFGMRLKAMRIGAESRAVCAPPK